MRPWTGLGTASWVVGGVGAAAVLALAVWYLTAHTDGIAALFTGDLLVLRLLAAILVIVPAGWAAGWVAKRLGQPSVIGEIFVGILLGPTLFGQVAPAVQQKVFAPALLPYLSGIASVGVALFMLIIGAGVSFGHARSAARVVGMMAASMFAVPVLCGIAVALVLAGHYRPQGVNPLAFVLFIGVAMGVTAFPVLARILHDRGLIGTRIGVLGLLTAGVGDVLAWCLLAATIALARGSSVLGVLGTLGLVVVFVVVALRVVRPRLRGLFTRLDKHRALAVTAVLGLGVVFSWVTETIGVHAIFGAFLAGAILPRGMPAVQTGIRFATGIVVLALPLFFTTIGFQINLVVSTSARDLLVCLVVIVVATVSKLAATSLAARAGGIGWRDSTGLGVMMNCRGLTELVVLSTGLTLGVIGADLFAIFVVMTLVTTTMTAPLLSAVRPRADG
jgi:Kef-type K+ transport system membrane component KefB